MDHPKLIVSNQREEFISGRLNEHYGRIQRGEHGVGTRLKNYKNMGFLSNTGPDHLKSTKLPSQYSMLAHHVPTSQTPLNGVSLAG